MSTPATPPAVSMDNVLQAALAATTRQVSLERILRAIEGLNAPSAKTIYPPLPILPVPEPDMKTPGGEEVYSRDKLTSHSYAVMRVFVEHFESRRPFVIGDHVSEATRCAERADHALEEFLYITESMNLRDVLGTDGLLKLVQTTDRLFRRSLITAQLGGVDDLDLSANCAFSERTLMGFRLHDAMSRPMDLPIGPEDDEPTNPEVHHSVPDVKIYEPGTF